MTPERFKRLQLEAESAAACREERGTPPGCVHSVSLLDCIVEPHDMLELLEAYRNFTKEK